MPQRLSDSMPKARKEHKCQACFITIHPGEVYSNETYVYEGRVYTWKTCIPCVLLCDTVYNWYAEDWGVGPEEYLEWSLENREVPEAAAYLERFGYEYPDD